MFGDISGVDASVNTGEEVEGELISMPDPHLKHLRVAALEMAMSLVLNRESSEDAVDITTMADVFFEWMNQDDADLGS